LGINILITLREKVINILLKNGFIEEKNIPIYVYGFTLLINNVLISMTMIFIGILLNHFVVSLIFMTMFTSLRNFTGGYHAKTYLQCYLLSNLIHLVVIAATFIEMTEQSKAYLTFGLCLLSALVILWLSPQNSKTNPKSPEQLIRDKKGIRIVVSVQVAFIAVCLYVGGIFLETGFVLSCVISAVAILSLFYKLENLKGDVTHEHH
jgi:accessory gene regulator B